MQQQQRDVVEALAQALGDRLCTDDATRQSHRRDTWMLAQLRDMEERGAPPPLAVVRAASTEDVARTLQICRAHDVPVIPWGAGSGVCGAIEATPEAVVLSTEDMRGLVELDERDLVATFRAGTMGIDAERRVQEAGLTIGHWPQSIELSSVGGWVATRAAGQFSTGYGNIEDMLIDLEVVLPDGSVLRTRRTPRASAGPDLRQLFLGSEGTLGVVTEVSLSLRPLPEASRGQTLHFSSFDDGLEAIRLLLRAGWAPPVVRLYDATESGRQFEAWCPDGRACLILLHEGPGALVDAQRSAALGIAQELGGEEGDAAAVDHWLERRNHVPTFAELLSKGLVVDTIEVAATWERIGGVYQAVVESLRQVPAIRAASAHSSHSYRSGTNLYFTFIARPDDRAQMESVYSECWRRTMEAVTAQGGGIAHHHGIGRVRRDHLSSEIGEAGLSVLRAVKHALDPQGLLNPGALLPRDANPASGASGSDTAR